MGGSIEFGQSDNAVIAGTQERELLKVPDRKFSPQEIKNVLFRDDWETVKELFGIGARGGSDPRVEVDDKQCEQIAADYPTLLDHWQKTSRNRKKEKNWRAYATIDEPDTPDDLLDRLDTDLPEQNESEGDDYPNIPSAIAHEHAARRVGIKANEYSLSRLKDFRKRGEAILGQSKNAG